MGHVYPLERSLCRSAWLLLVVAALGGAHIGCRRPEDTAVPVATPSLALSRNEAAVGSPIDLTFRFAVAPTAPAFAEDYWVFVHFVDEDGELLWTEDHDPATPTRSWKAGQTIEYSRTMFIPRFPEEGQVSVELGLFSPRSGERLPLAGETRGMRAYQVGTLDLRLETPIPIAFRAGWHDVEVSDDAIGIEWQWSMGKSSLAFPNPKRDVEFFIQVDQPIALPAPQQVQVIVGSAVVDAFTLPPRVSQVRRAMLPAAQLGGTDTVDVVIAVDRTFVPATIPGLQNPDTRELGIRVFRVFVRPA